MLPADRESRIQLVTMVLCCAIISCGGAEPSAEHQVTSQAGEAFSIEVVYEGLDLPASLAFAPDGDLLILDRGFTSQRTTSLPSLAVFDVKAGHLKTLEGRIQATSHFDDRSGNQGGAMGLALDPQFATNRRVFVCYHHRASSGALENRLSSFEINSGRLEQEHVLLNHLPGDDNHNGCRVVIDDEGLLYLTTGSLEPFDDALDLSRLSGKVLRVTRTGAVPLDNPFPNSPIWSYGHRNPQGLAFDPSTRTLWSTEHGENSADELNRIERGANYGWPACRGSAAIGESFAVESFWADRLRIEAGRATCVLSEPHASRYRPAFRTYYADSTVGISDLVVYRGDAFPQWRGSLLITMLRARQLLRLEVKDGGAVLEQTLISEQFGRLRDVTVGPDGLIYVLTNEPDKDGGWKGHSRLLRIRPAGRSTTR